MNETLIVLCFFTLLAAGFTLRFNDGYSIQKVTRPSYLIFKISLFFTIAAYIVSWFTQGVNWLIVPIVLSFIAGITLLINDRVNGEAQRTFANEHAKRPALDKFTTRIVSIIGLLIIACFIGTYVQIA